MTEADLTMIGGVLLVGIAVFAIGVAVIAGIVILIVRSARHRS